jgi:hypothetical protein
MRFLAVAICVLALSGCSVAKKQTKSPFTGPKAQVAAVFSTLESASHSADKKKICNQVLSTTLAASYGGARGCQDRVSDILDDADPTELQMKPLTITLGAGASPTTATARVQSGSGKSPEHGTVQLVKQGNSWRIDSFG